MSCDGKWHYDHFDGLPYYLTEWGSKSIPDGSFAFHFDPSWTFDFPNNHLSLIIEESTRGFIAWSLELCDAFQNCPGKFWLIDTGINPKEHSHSHSLGNSKDSVQPEIFRDCECEYIEVPTREIHPEEFRDEKRTAIYFLNQIYGVFKHQYPPISYPPGVSHNPTSILTFRLRVLAVAPHIVKCGSELQETILGL